MNYAPTYATHMAIASQSTDAISRYHTIPALQLYAGPTDYYQKNKLTYTGLEEFLVVVRKWNEVRPQWVNEFGLLIT